MSLFVSSLNSGSNGNCYYIGNDSDAVLVDAGISCRETEKRLLRLELSIKKIKAIFITHEHGDHIYGVSRLSRKFKIPVYITAETMRNGRLHLRDQLVFSFTAYQPVVIGSLTITPFPIYHDAVDPHNFVVNGSGVNVGVFTDIGKSCKNVIKNFKECHAAFLESNYDIGMLENGSYPLALKNRIRDGRGHLSNMEALQLFVTHRPSFMTHLFLGHLSENNNRPDIVSDLFKKMAGNIEIMIASRESESPVYRIRTSSGSFRSYADHKKQEQLSLF